MHDRVPAAGVDGQRVEQKDALVVRLHDDVAEVCSRLQIGAVQQALFRSAVCLGGPEQAVQRFFDRAEFFPQGIVGVAVFHKFTFFFYYTIRFRIGQVFFCRKRKNRRSPCAAQERKGFRRRRPTCGNGRVGMPGESGRFSVLPTRCVEGRSAESVRRFRMKNSPVQHS